MTRKALISIRERRARRAHENRLAAYHALMAGGGESPWPSIIDQMARGVLQPVFGKSDR